MERPVTCIACKQSITWTGKRFICRCSGKTPEIDPADMPAMTAYMNSVENPPAQPRPVESVEVEL